MNSYKIDLTANIRQRAEIDLTASVRQGMVITLIETIRHTAKMESNLSAFIDQLPPQTPQNVQAVDIEKGDSVVLNWDENIEPNVLHYKIYRKEGEDWIYVGQTEKPPHQVGGLQQGQTYYFAISAVAVGQTGERWIDFTVETWGEMGSRRWID